MIEMIFGKSDEVPKKQVRVRFIFEMNVGVEELEEQGGLKELVKEIRKDLKEEQESEKEEWRNVKMSIREVPRV